MNLAGVTGRVEDAVAAREALRGARAFMGDAPLISVTSLFLQCVGCGNCRVHGRLDEAKQWLAEAADDFRAAGTGACRVLPNSLRARTIYLYLRDGSAESLNAENREAGRKGADTAPCHAYLASLFRRGKTDDALEYLRTLPIEGSSTRSFSRIAFLVGRDIDAARDDCRRALAKERRPHLLSGLILSLSLIGLHEEARQQAKIFSASQNDWPGFSEFESFSRRLYAHVYEGKAMDVVPEVADNSLKRGILANTMGFAALGRGDRAAACAWFRKADQIPLLDDYLMQAIRARVIKDPNWPPWLATKKQEK